jgi:hypothetical protein
MLSLAFNESYIEDCTIDLNLDPIYQPAFEYIYNRILNKDYPLNYSIISNILLLADYLGVDKVLNELTPIFIELIIEGHIFSNQIINVINNKILEATYILSQHNLPD